MTILANVPRAVRGPLSIDITERGVDNGVRDIKLTVNSFAWPNPGAKVGSVALQFSFDRGETYLYGFTMDFAGGQISYKGNPDTPRSLGWRLPQAADNDTRVKGNVTLLVSLDCSATLEAV